MLANENTVVNYVKFMRGSSSGFQNLLSAGEVEEDTLYFIFDTDDAIADLYLGTRKISGDGNNSSSNITSLILSDLKDIDIKDVKNDDLLIYNNGVWTNESAGTIFSNYAEDMTTSSTATIVENVNNKDHQILINEKSPSPKANEIIIIKDLIYDDKYFYSSYIFNNDQWQALNGNYSAENIYFDNDFIFTENIGTIEVSAETGNTTVSAKGKNLKEFLSTIFAEEKASTVTQPSATIALGSSVTNYEVGSSYSPSYSITFNAGSYSYGPSYTNVIPTYSVSDTKGNSSTLASDTFDSFTIEDNNNYSITANIAYTQGDIPLTNLGNKDPDSRIQAGTLTSIVSKTITGYRKSFYGVLNHKDEYLIRDLNSSTSALKNGSSFVINLKEDTKRVVIAYPATLQDLSSVLDFNDSNANIVQGFGEPEIIKVEGANGYDAIDYKVYTLPFADPYGTSNKFTVTI